MHHNRHNRRSIRLKGHDYSGGGAYFVTMVMQGRECLLGAVSNDQVVLNAAGDMVVKWWNKLPEKFPGVVLNAFVAMPNHVHGLIVIATRYSSAAGQTHGSAPTDMHLREGADPCVRPVAPSDSLQPSLGQLLQWFKTMTTNEYIRGVKNLGWEPFRGKMWQRNYFDRVVRGPAEFDRIKRHILANPLRWNEDHENPDR